MLIYSQSRCAPLIICQQSLRLGCAHVHLRYHCEHEGQNYVHANGKHVHQIGAWAILSCHFR